jgi:hypothetical protein
MLFALGSLWAGRNGRFWPAGVLGLLAALTRLTGWVLVVPLAYEVVRREVGSGQWEAGSREQGGRERFSFLAPLLPVVGVIGFLVWRWWVGLPALTVIYERYWYQTTGFPGRDVLTAANTLFFGGPVRANEIIALSFDFACMLLLFVTTALAFRRLGTTYGLYSAMLLLFMLLPTSELKPLYSFSRYTLAFLPTFMLLGLTGQRPWLNRLILYPSVALYLYFSGQFFSWGWVA